MLFIVFLGIIALSYSVFRKRKIEKYYVENKHILPMIPQISAEDGNHVLGCDYVIKDLEDEGKKHLTNIKNFDRKSIPQRGSKCMVCDSAMQGWSKFYDSLDRFSAFLKSGTVPQPPIKEAGSANTSPCCKITEENCEKYMETVRKEIECLQQAKKNPPLEGRPQEQSECPQTKLPEFSLGNDQCYSCKNIYEKWALITFTLLDIAHYLRMTT